MLLLSRQEGESIFISPSEDANLSMTLGELFAEGALELAVTEIKGGRVKIGLDAPKELLIMRGEIFD